MIFVAVFFGSIIAFLGNFYLSTKLGPENFGIFKTVTYLFFFLPALINFGVQATLPKYIAEFKAKNKKKIGHLVLWFLKTRLIGFLILGILIFLFRYQIAIYFFHDTALSYLILPGLIYFFSLFFAILPLIVQGYQNFKLFALVAFLAYALPPMVAITLISSGLFYMILGFGLATAVSYLIALRFLFKVKAFTGFVHFDLRKIIWSFSMPMYGLYLIMALSSLTIPIFSLFFIQKIIGYLSYSLLFYTASLLVSGVISFVVLPKTSELNALKKYKAAKNLLGKTFSLYTPVAFFGSILVLLLSKLFISIVSPEYLPSLPLFNALVVLGLFSGYGMIYSAYLQGQGNVKRTAVVILAVNILLFLISYMFLNYIA